MMALVVVGLDNDIDTCLDGSSEDWSMPHVTRNRHPISRRHIVDTFRLPLILILNTVIDSLLPFLQFPKDGLSSSNKFVFPLIDSIKLSLVAGGILIILSKT